MNDKKTNYCRIKNLPVSFFSVVMGLVGFTIAWQKAEHVLNLNWGVSNYLLWLSVVVLVVLLLLYLVKLMFWNSEVIREFNNPVKVNFFPTISISLLLLAVAFLDLAPVWSYWLWVVGTVAHFIFTFVIISIWIGEKVHDVKNMNPAWFIPVVGNILVPVAGVSHIHSDVSWFYFAIGLVFWVVLFTIVFYRVIFHHPIVEKMGHTLFIMVAPPAVGFIAYYKLTGQVDSFAKILYFFALFMFIFLVARMYSLWKRKFYLSWWAYSFPSAAMTIATILYYHVSGWLAYYYISIGLLIILTVIIIMLFGRTLWAVSRREICVEE